MKMKHLYACLCVVGTLIPLGVFLPWLELNGFSPILLLSNATEDPVALFAWSDVIISALALFAFIWVEGRQLKMQALWLPVLLTCMVGVSLGFPLFLLMRELHLQKQDTV